MKFELEKFHRNISEKDLLDDLKNTHAVLSKNNISLTFRTYNETGKYRTSTIIARFGSWNKGLKQAGLGVNQEKNISDKDLFVNIEEVWTSLGRQPKTRDLVKPFSKYTPSAYLERFGGWRNSLEAFVKYINEEDELDEVNNEIEEDSILTRVVKREEQIEIFLTECDLEFFQEMVLPVNLVGLVQSNNEELNYTLTTYCLGQRMVKQLKKTYKLNV